MKKLLYTMLLLPFITLAQRDYIAEGNALLSENKNKEAEALFKEAVHSQKDNLSYQTQLGLALINQEKFSEAEKILEKVLEKEENNSNATAVKLTDLKAAQQVVLVQITSDDNRIVTKKVVY